ncbi:hypothetical protein H2200_010739 [Cladophialophora chaetospira]|uniref:Myb-like domain-containing protein n=1 Tax=Cladophialophora chaetospira TaxID=386627 RepID=A0AA39CDS0_9EURO|nr:hypothetical protein H2200_010739 [Cladophialophora chaetospira]
MPYKWDAASERNLLLFAITTLGTPKAEVWDQVAKMIEPGGSLNANACSQKFYKLKKESEKLMAEGGGAVISTDPATPVKTPGKGTGGRKRKSTDGDADGETPTPTKRRASTKKKTAPAPEPEVKDESAEEPEAETEAEETAATKVEETEDAKAD